MFWQESPSPHQAPWIRCLPEIWPDVTVVGVFRSRLADKRISLGWHLPDYGKMRVLLSPGRLILEDLLLDDPGGTIHIFSGGENARLNSAIKEALLAGSLVGILSEGRDWRRLQGILRQGHSLLNERIYRKRVHFVLAMGHLATRWYQTCGFNQEQIFPFCYVVEKSETASQGRSNSSLVNLSFVGQLIRRKRVDLLVNSLYRIKSKNWNLRIIGDGKERLAIEKLVQRRQLTKLIDMTGVLDNSAVRTQLALSDVVVLPSQWDGWGAVVNESLMSGVPVICSDFCGASDLILPKFNGDLFESCSVDSLAEVLEEWISMGPLNAPARERIFNWSRCIEGKTVAGYFIEIIDYLQGTRSERPKAPWLTENGRQEL